MERCDSGRQNKPRQSIIVCVHYVLGDAGNMDMDMDDDDGITTGAEAQVARDVPIGLRSVQSINDQWRKTIRWIIDLRAHYGSLHLDPNNAHIPLVTAEHLFMFTSPVGSFARLYACPG